MALRHHLGALVGVLSMHLVHLPHHGRSRVSEARTNLGGIKTNLESFRATEDTYVSLAPVPSGSVSPERRTWDAVPCNPACNRRNAGACTSFDCIGFKPAGDVRYTYACNSIMTGGTPDFTCVAVGDLDGDGELGVFVYGTANARGREEAAKIVAPVPEIAGRSCDGAAAFEVVDCHVGSF